MKKILVISMKAGLGHVMAAKAIEKFAKGNFSDLEIDHVDFCDIEPRLGNFFNKFYSITSERLPLVWGTIYETLNKQSVSSAVHNSDGFQRLFRIQIEHFLKMKKPDGVIFTNVIPAPWVAPPCRNLFSDIPLGVVITDYHGHSYYNVPFINHYFVAISEVKNDLICAGVDEDKISVTGIPVGEEFYGTYNQTNIKEKLGFEDEYKTVLFISRLSNNFIIPSLERLLKMDEPINLAMICGGNIDLYKKIKKRISPQRNFILVNWANRVDEYMKAADVVVSKPGGMVISECLALGKKLIMTNPIPGQEERNAKFMATCGYGKMVFGPDQIAAAVRETLILPKPDQISTCSNASCKILSYFREFI